MKLWVAGQLFDEENAWGFVGVFSCEERALSAIRNLQNGFVAPAVLNECAPKKMAWPGSYVPNFEPLAMQ